MNYQIGSTIFRDWKITRELGEGSYGKVFEIQKIKFGVTTTSALKILQVPKSQADVDMAYSEGIDEKSLSSYYQDCVERLVREIAILSELKSHPNIVGYEDHDEIPHTDSFGWDILIRMELLTSLPSYQRQHALSEKDVIRLGCDMCSALSFCHKKNLIHRDIKPANIFINELGHYKLGDFGVSRNMEATISHMSKAGTESYMAPEVYLGRPYSANVDLYSLGLVLFQLSNRGRLPFLPPAPQPILYSHREQALSRRMSGEDIPTPQDASHAFAEVIRKACAYDPKARYQTADEMLAALRQLDIRPLTSPLESGAGSHSPISSVSSDLHKTDGQQFSFSGLGSLKDLEDLENNEQSTGSLEHSGSLEELDSGTEATVSVFGASPRSPKGTAPAEPVNSGSQVSSSTPKPGNHASSSTPNFGQYTQSSVDDSLDVLTRYLVTTFQKQEGIDLSTDRLALQRLTEAAAKAKTALSSAASTHISLPYITATVSGPKHFEMDLTRTELDLLLKGSARGSDTNTSSNPFLREDTNEFGAIADHNAGSKADPPSFGATAGSNAFPTYTFDRYPEGVYREMVLHHGKSGEGEVWVTRAYVEEVASGQIKDPQMHVSFTSNNVWTYNGDELRSFMRRAAQDLQDGHRSLKIITRYPQCSGLQDSFVIHVIETTHDQAAIAQLDGVSTMILLLDHRPGTPLSKNAQWIGTDNSRPTIALLNKWVLLNPFLELASSLQRKPRRFQITNQVTFNNLCRYNVSSVGDPFTFMQIPAVMLRSQLCPILCHPIETLPSGGQIYTADICVIESIVNTNLAAIRNLEDDSITLIKKAKLGLFGLGQDTFTELSPHDLQYGSLRAIFEGTFQDFFCKPDQQRSSRKK